MLYKRDDVPRRPSVLEALKHVRFVNSHRRFLVDLDHDLLPCPVVNAHDDVTELPQFRRRYRRVMRDRKL